MALEKGSWDFMRDKNYDGMKNSPWARMRF